MSNNVDLSKYKRLSRIIRVVVKIFFILSLVGAGFAFTLGIAMALFPALPVADMLVKGGTFSVSIDNLLMFRIDPQSAELDNIKPILVSLSFMASVVSAVMAVIFKQLTSILDTIKADKPFAMENSKRLNIIGATLIAASFVIRIAECIVASTIVNTLKLTGMSINYSADTNLIIMGFIIFILAGVFKYGCFLQQEYDSTV